jgi:pilus assembly protein Flp/PilA
MKEACVKNETGATALEYALLAALIAVVIIAAVTFLGREASEAFSKVGSALNRT